jgi:crotonobetainyl-CoA:carnitine CoA-transferase CaiB-like acyl-CoA transferase
MRHFLTQPVTLSRTPADVVRTAPGWGEHTDEILKGVGYDEAGIAALREQGVV